MKEICIMVKVPDDFEPTPEWGVNDEAMEQIAIGNWTQVSGEPCAWAIKRDDGLVLDVICPDEHDSFEGAYTVPLFAAPQPAVSGEPVAWMYDFHADYDEIATDWLSHDYEESHSPTMGCHNIRPLYAAPQPLRELSDEETWEIWKGAVDKADRTGDVVAFTYRDALIAKLKS